MAPAAEAFTGVGEEWFLPGPPAVFEATGFGNEVSLTGQAPSKTTHWCWSFNLKVRQEGVETVKAFTLPVVCSLWTSDEKTDFGVAVLCYVSYYEGGRKNQFKCLIPTGDSFRWVTHHALRNSPTFGGDDLPAYVEDWMKEWETSSAPIYGRGITKQEVNVEESSDSDATPLAQRKLGQPSDLKGEGPKKPKPEGKKGGTPAAGRQQAAAAGSVPGSDGPVTLSATSVHNIVGALSEDFASGVLASVKNAVTFEAASVLAAALREERRSEVAARLKRQEGKTKKNGGQTGLGLC